MASDTLFQDIHNPLIEQNRRGEKMDTEMQLAERFNVSRYRVRRVLDQLSQMGVVDRAQKRGMTVNSVTPERLTQSFSSQLEVASFDIREFLEARIGIETEIILLSVMRVTPVLIGQLDQTLRQMRACIESPSAALAFHTTFHKLLIEAGGNRVFQVFALALLEHWNKLLLQTEALDPAFFAQIMDADQELLTAVKVGDESRAKRVLADELRQEMVYLIN